MWLDDKNRRYYNLNAEQWAVAKNEVSQGYPRAEPIDFSEVAKIADVCISRSLAHVIDLSNAV